MLWGQPLKSGAPKSVKNDVCTYSLDPACLKKGLNVFAVAFPAGASKAATFNDFSITVLSGAQSVK